MLLAIDTSTEWIGMALFNGDQIISEQIWKSHNYHTVDLVPAIERMLKQSTIAKKDLTGLGIALGPGSFTGLRIGMAVTKGLALALNIPVVGIPSLDILAAAQPAMDIPLLAILQAGRGRLACMRYNSKGDGWVPQGEMQVGDARELGQLIDAPIYICGEMTPQEKQILGRKWKTVRMASPSQCLRRPAVLAELAWGKLQSGEAADVNALAPIYIHTASAIPEV